MECLVSYEVKFEGKVEFRLEKKYFKREDLVRVLWREFIFGIVRSGLRCWIGNLELNFVELWWKLREERRSWLIEKNSYVMVKGNLDWDEVIELGEF